MNIRIAIAILCGLMLPAAALAEGAPKIKFEKLEHDFGTVLGTEKVQGVFHFENVGDAPLKIEKPQSSCGCTVPTLKNDLLQPGEKGELPFTLDFGKSRANNLQRTIYVSSNDPENPKVQLSIKGSYVPRFEAVPALARVNVRQGSETNITVQLKRNDEKELVVGKVEGSKDWVQPKFERSSTDKTSGTLTIRLQPEGGPGQFTESVSVFGEDSEKAELLVRIMGKTVGELTARPETVFWNVVDPSKVKEEGNDALVKRTITVSAVDPTQPFELSAPSSTLPELSVAVIPAANAKGYQIVATLKQAPEHTARGTISVETNLPKQPKIEIPVTISVPNLPARPVDL